MNPSATAHDDENQHPNTAAAEKSTSENFVSSLIDSPQLSFRDDSVLKYHSEKAAHALTLRRVVTVDELSPSKPEDFESFPQSTPRKKYSHQQISPASTQWTSPRSSINNNTTFLSILIQNQEYCQAIKRLRDFPGEASIWVTAKRLRTFSPHAFGGSSTKLIAPLRQTISTEKESYQRLPIHIACGNLATASESKLRFYLEQLILRLVLVFPEGCALVDYDNRLPLHEAIWNNATPETISMLLIADPTSLYHKDACGRTAADVNDHHSNGVFTTQVSHLLSMGASFWEETRRNVADRFVGCRQMTTPPANLQGKSDQVDDQHSLTSFSVHHRMSPGYDSSITLDQDSESVISEIVHSMLGNHEASNKHQQPLLQPVDLKRCFDDQRAVEITASQATHSAKENESETRAAILQGMLSKMYENNHALTSAINELTQTNSRLREQVEEITTPLPVSTNDSNNNMEMEVLEANKSVIRKHLVLRQSNAYQSFDLGGNEELLPVSFPAILTANKMPEASLSEVMALKAQNHLLKEKVYRLKRKRKKQAEKIRYLKSIVTTTGSESFLVGLSDSESASTFSVNSATASFTFSDPDISEYSSTASSFLLRRDNNLEDSYAQHSILGDKSNFVITGLASYRMKDFVCRLQKKVLTSSEMCKSDGVASGAFPIESDDITEICLMAAEIYSGHVKECPWRHGELILQWEEGTSVKHSEVPFDEPGVCVSQKPDLASSTGPVPDLIPAKRLDGCVSNDLDSIVSYSETSLSSIGMQSLGERLWK